MLFRPKRARRGALGDTPPRSLFRAILNWVLLPFLALWPASVFVVYKIAVVLANQPYDAALAESVRAISRQVQPGAAGLLVDFPVPPKTLLRDDGEDAVYYQVLGPRREFISGERELPLGALPAHVRSGEVYFRDDQILGRDVRVGFQFVRLESEPPEWAQVHVAETRNKRNALAYRIIAGVLLPQLFMLPLAVLLLHLGLRRGLSPLAQLQKRIHHRRPNDLSPIDIERAPLEVRPLLCAFNSMMQQLATSLTAQQRFIADAAHQLRTPLTGLKMQAELAVNEHDPETLRKLLPNLAASTNRACHLVNQLLVLARAEAGAGPPAPIRQVDLESVCVQTASDLVPQARAKRIDIEFQRPSDRVTVAGDAFLLAELIKNLLDNAIKYTPPGGDVVLRLHASDHAVIEVLDNGVGVTEVDREHVFDRFYRVLGSESEGSGLGLPIAREIAARHQASVELLDNPSGRGCLARVRIPLAPRGAAPGVGLADGNAPNIPHPKPRRELSMG